MQLKPVVTGLRRAPEGQGDRPWLAFSAPKSGGQEQRNGATLRDARTIRPIPSGNSRPDQRGPARPIDNGQPIVDIVAGKSAGTQQFEGFQHRRSVHQGPPGVRFGQPTPHPCETHRLVDENIRRRYLKVRCDGRRRRDLSCKSPGPESRAVRPGNTVIAQRQIVRMYPHMAVSQPAGSLPE